VQLPTDHGTSHLCVVDAQGNAVACTETVNLGFGSLLIAAPFGFVLNDQMDDFTTRPDEPNAFGLRQSVQNLPAPLKRPLSSMTPTIVLRDGRPEILAGASGGPRIISGSIQAMLNVLYFDMPAEEAVRSPRFHHQYLPDRLEFEDNWQDAGVKADLAAMGHTLWHTEAVGNVQLIRRTPGGYDAACDPRKGGKPAGY
jgi:gamma-glutamyltranspeptidase/glutathione hydrolase